MRLIVDNGKVEYDIPYDNVVLEVRAGSSGNGLLYCDKVSQSSIFAFPNETAARKMLRSIAESSNKGASYFYLCKEYMDGIAVP